MQINAIAARQLKSRGLLADVAARLSMTDREIARELGLSVAALRAVDRSNCPHYLKLALAALVVDINVDTVLQALSAARSPTSLGQPPPKQEVDC